MAGRGRTPGFVMTPEHRSKIKVTQLLNRLQNVATGMVEGASVGDSVRAAEILLRKAMPDLSAQEITGDVTNYVARLPEPAKTVEAWEQSLVTSQLPKAKVAKDKALN